MEPCKIFLVFNLVVYGAKCLVLGEKTPKPEIVCEVNFYPEISAEMLVKLEACDHIIISYDSLCDLAKHLRNFTDLKRIDLIRSRAPRAKVLRRFAIQFDEKFDSQHEVQNIQASLVRGLFDGIDLVFDSSQLDPSGQIKYAHFLKLLKHNLGKHVLITTSFICQKHMPAFMLKAMHILDYVILLPPTQNVSAEGYVLEPRVYSDSEANCLLSANFPRNKIVLGLPTGGTLVDASMDRHSQSSLIPYGKVCELHEEQQRRCKELPYQVCSVLNDGVKLIYDDPNSAAGRALQSVGRRLRGIAIRLNYDDSSGICVGSRFPLLKAIQNIFEQRSGVSNFQGCPPGSDESGEGFNEEHELLISSHSSGPHHLNSVEGGEGSNVQGKLHHRCHMRDRLEETLKSSKNVAIISNSVTDKVLGSLDRVATLVSLMLQYRSKRPYGPLVLQPDANPSSLLSLSTAFSAGVDQNMSAEPKHVQTVEENQISSSRTDPVQTDQANHNPPSGTDPIQNDETNHEPSTELDPVHAVEENQNSPSGPNPVQNAVSTGLGSEHTVADHHNPQSGPNPIQNDEVNRDSPTALDPLHTVKEDHNQPFGPDSTANDAPTGTDLELTVEENQDPPSGPDTIQNDEANNFSPTEPDPELTVEKHHNLPSGPDPIQKDEINNNSSAESDPELTVEEHHKPPSRPDPIQKDEVNNNSSAEPDPEPTVEEHQNPPAAPAETVEENQDPSSELDSMQKDEVNHDSPTGSDPEQTGKENQA